ncbi:hypothetical protein [Streptomyces lucensis]|uniref:hypothetical protein n=1 Tax=Streptomyces lucensis TaxID=67319 RepID=UPI0016730ED0|nr:hypothetical protein [Streptomyces lucensis]
MTSLTSLRWSNLLLGLGIASLIAGETAAWRWRTLQEDEFRRLYATLQQRQRRILEGMLTIVCKLVAKTLNIPCNARYFVAEKDQEGRYYIRQDRDLAVLNIRMPREFGFTRIYVDTPHIVSGKAFRDRVPLYEELPDDHSNWYEPDVGRMIEPQQRWVLACPVLRLDSLTNSHEMSHAPRGVIVFYGTQLPDEAASADAVQVCLGYAEQFAEQMSHVFNMLELSTELESSSHGNTSGTS